MSLSMSILLQVAHANQCRHWRTSNMCSVENGGTNVCRRIWQYLVRSLCVSIYTITFSYAQMESCRQQASMIIQCVGAQCQPDGTCGKKTSTVGRTCKKNTSCQKKSGYSDGICIRHEVTRVKKCLCPPDKAGSKCDLLPSSNEPESHYVSSKAIAFFFR